MQLCHQAAPHQCVLQSPILFVFFLYTWHKSILRHYNTAESLGEMSLFIRGSFKGSANDFTDECKHPSNFFPPHLEFVLFFIMWSSLEVHLFICLFCSSPLVFQYNSVNMKNKTAEEVYVEMLKPAETVTFKVQHRPDDFSMLKDVPGDGFYIRYVYYAYIHVTHSHKSLLGIYVVQH